MADEDIIRTLAEKCMGWTPVHEKFAPHCGCSMVYDQRKDTLGMRFIGPACGVTLHAEKDRWNPLSSISDAFMVVKRMRELGWNFICAADSVPDPDWAVNFQRRGVGNPVFGGDGATAPRAICLAAIAALEGTVNG